MAPGPDPESQKPESQLDSPHDSESDSEISSKPQPPTGYNLPLWRKCLILFVVSWMTLAVTFSSTSLLPATPEIASEFSTTTEILNIINAGVLIAMGFSSFIWGPITDLFGRRSAYNAAIMVLCACSAGTAVAINLHMFIAMRLLCGFTGTFFMVAGQTIIADIFEPVSHFLNILLGGRVADNIHVIGRARDSRGLHDGRFSQWSCNR
jgi:predicted MFS family arabinose efflux permease